jgi:DNA-binding MarR family transcriptional regulator
MNAEFSSDPIDNFDPYAIEDMFQLNVYRLCDSITCNADIDLNEIVEKRISPQLVLLSWVIQSLRIVEKAATMTERLAATSDFHKRLDQFSAIREQVNTSAFVRLSECAVDLIHHSSIGYDGTRDRQQLNWTLALEYAHRLPLLEWADEEFEDGTTYDNVRAIWRRNGAPQPAYWTDGFAESVVGVLVAITRLDALARRFKDRDGTSFVNALLAKESGANELQAELQLIQELASGSRIREMLNTAINAASDEPQKRSEPDWSRGLIELAKIPENFRSKRMSLTDAAKKIYADLKIRDEKQLRELLKKSIGDGEQRAAKITMNLYVFDTQVAKALAPNSSPTTGIKRRVSRAKMSGKSGNS